MNDENYLPDEQLSDFELLRKYADTEYDRLDLHAFRWQANVPPPAPISLSEKLKHLIWTGKDYDVIQLPADENWYQREGYDMSHCLQYLHKRYAEAAKNKDIILYSMIDRAGNPQVDIELAIAKGYGVWISVDKPTTTQIRGFRNQCPPANHLLPDLVAFLLDYGKEWDIVCHRPNFDGKYDGALLTLRWMQLNPPNS